MKLRQLIIILSFISYTAGFLLGLSTEKDSIDCDVSPSSTQEFQEILSTREESQFTSFIFIARNNLVVVLRNLILGIFSLGLFSLIYVFYNAYVHGYIISSLSPFLTAQDVMGCTIPHSMELIPLILSSLVGFAISYQILFKKRILPTKKIVWLTLACVGITVLSALIESYISMS